MDSDINEIIDESVKLELNVSRLYSIFYDFYLEDSDFWWELQMEEKNHASLLKSIKEFFVPYGKIPEGLLVKELETLKQSNLEIESIIQQVIDNTPTREECFDIALELEHSASETHYQMFMDTNTGDKFSEVIQTLNREDKDHALRIENYIKEKF